MHGLKLEAETFIKYYFVADTDELAAIDKIVHMLCLVYRVLSP